MLRVQFLHAAVLGPWDASNAHQPADALYRERERDWHFSKVTVIGNRPEEARVERIVAMN